MNIKNTALLLVGVLTLQGTAFAENITGRVSSVNYANEEVSVVRAGTKTSLLNDLIYCV